MKTFIQFLAEREPLEPVDPEISNMYRSGVDDDIIIKFISKHKQMTKEEAIAYYESLAKSKGKK